MRANREERERDAPAGMRWTGKVVFVQGRQRGNISSVSGRRRKAERKKSKKEVPAAIGGCTLEKRRSWRYPLNDAG